METSDFGSYGAIAAVYDRLNSGIDYELWADFFEKCFDRWLASRPELVLDLACGTGSMTIALTKRGYDMTGIDGSPDMLSVAYGRAYDSGVNILFLGQDMRSFELYGTVGAVVSCLDSINYLTDDGDLKKCFSLVHNYLDPDGLFLFDVNTPYKFREVYGTSQYILEDGDDIYCGWQNNFDEESGLCEFDLSLFLKTRDGKYRRSNEVQYERCYSADFLTKTLTDSGFEVLGFFSDYKFTSPDDNCERWYIAARAKK